MNDWFDAEQRAERSQQLSESRRWAEALAEIDAALQVNPSNVAWVAQRGFLLDQLEQFDDAIEAYKSLLEDDPDDREVLLALGIDLERVGRLAESSETFQRLTSAFPDFEPGFCFQILLYAELEQHDKAEEMFYLAQQLREDCPNCFYHMGISLAERGDFERAIFCWRRVLDIDPEFENIRGQMARAYRAMNDQDRAVEWYLTAIREDPGDTELHYEMGHLLAESEDWSRAAAKFRQVIELEPDHVDGHFALAEVLLLSGEAESALELLKQVGAFDEQYPGLELRLGSACLKLGRHKDARKHLDRAVEEAPTSEALMLLGNCLLWLQKPAIAADQFRRVIAIDERVPNAHHNLGVCCFLTGEHEAGIKHCRRALELKPDYILAVVKLVLAYERLGRFAEVREMIEYGLRIDGDNALLQHLQDRLWKSRIRHGLRRVASVCRTILTLGRSR
jgi:tetratricopeptide (TPR) repeat protein